MHLNFDKPGGHAHLQRKGFHALVHARQSGVYQRRAVTGVCGRGINVEHRCRAGGELSGASQVLQL